MIKITLELEVSRVSPGFLMEIADELPEFLGKLYCLKEWNTYILKADNSTVSGHGHGYSIKTG